MSEMTERVAKAIFESTMSMHAPQSWDKCNEGQRENVRRSARAAIEAMREPTSAMVEPWYLSDDTDAAELWREMIDVALREKVDA